jgi:hypothetical protein
MYDLSFSRSSIADSTCPHPSPDCLTYARLPYHSMSSTSDILIRCTSPLVMIRCQYGWYTLHTLLVSQVESELVLSVELVSALLP